MGTGNYNQNAWVSDDLALVPKAETATLGVGPPGAPKRRLGPTAAQPLSTGSFRTGSCRASHSDRPTAATDPLLTAGRPSWAPQSCHWQLQNSNVSLCSGSSRRAGVQPIRRRRALALLPGIRRGAARWTATHSSPVSAINDFIEYNAADPGASTWPHSPFAI